MNAIAKSSLFQMLRHGASLLAAIGFCAAVHLCSAAPPFVYETPNEFLAAGDFNGDGVPDVLVIDKLTGNARVGYANSIGDLDWSAPLITGVAGPTGCAIGVFLFSGRDAVALTAPSFNEVNLVDLSGTNAAGTPIVVTPSGLGPHTVIAMVDSLAVPPPVYNDLLVASSNNDDSAEFLDLMSINAGVGTEKGQYQETGPFDRGNAIQLSMPSPLQPSPTLAAGIVRGTNDTLHVWQFTNTPDVMLSYSNLPSGSDYAFGVFYSPGEGPTNPPLSLPVPRFFFYLPGGSNVTVVPLFQTGGNFAFGAPSVVPLSERVQEVFFESTVGDGPQGSAIILFSNGIQSLTFPSNSPVLSPLYGSGAGASGDVFTGVVPLGNGMLSLLDAPPGGTSSVHSQVLQFNGSSFTQLSSSNLPPLTARNTRANVWLFQTEPFVNRSATFIASYNTPDWSDSVSGLPGALTVTVQNDGGASTGLEAPTTSSLAAPPTGSSYGLANQYNSAISLFSYSSSQAAQPVTVTISPPPGIYDGPISISFSTLEASDKVYYRVGAGGSWQFYAASFVLSNNNTVDYYGTNAASPARSQLLTAAYSLGINGSPTPTVNLSTGTSSTNPPPAFISPSNTVLSPVGTIFYGRRSVLNTGSIWAINYDGSGDTYITAGFHPRVSHDGKWLVFMHGVGAYLGQGNIWIHNLQTGQESLLFSNTATITCYDWVRNDSAILMDYDCAFWLLDTNGTLSTLVNTDCYEQAPVINPVNGRIAFHDVNPDNVTLDGLYVASSNGGGAQLIVSTVLGATWPEWSPDGLKLSFADDNSFSSLDTGTNLWVVSPDGSSLSRICDFTGTTNHFPHGAVWSLDSTSLVGAGTIYGTNGLWIIPLNSDRTDCQGAPTLLPTTPGDPIDFAGCIISSQPPVPSPVLTLPTSVNTNTFTINWGLGFSNYTLEYTESLAPPIIWLPVPGPYSNNGFNYIYAEPFDKLVSEKFFRLSPLSP
jgi:hypothetical protein